MKIDLALIGCGETGTAIAEMLARSDLEYTLHAFDRNDEKVNRVCDISARHTACYSFERILSTKPTFVIEAASREFVKEYGFSIIRNGINLICLSNGVLCDNHVSDELAASARNYGSKIYFPSVPPGLDAAIVLYEIGINYACYSSSRGMNHPLARQFGEGVYFSGSVREAMAAFPKSLNPGAALAEVGKGYDKTQIRVEFDSRINGFEMGLEIGTSMATFNAKLSGAMETASGRAPFWAAASVVALLRRLQSPLVYGV